MPPPVRGVRAASGSGPDALRPGGAIRSWANGQPGRLRLPGAGAWGLFCAVGLAWLLVGARPVCGREQPQVSLVIDDCVAVEQAQVRHLLSLELRAPLQDGASAPGGTRATVTCRAPDKPSPSHDEPRADASTAAPERPATPTDGTEKPATTSAPPTPASGATGEPAEPPTAAERADVVELRVDDAVTGKSLWRSIELQKADPGVRARLLSLALSELIFASWAELLVTPEPAVPPALPAASAAARQATSVQIERKLPRPLPPLGVQLSALGSAYVLGSEPSVFFGGGLRVTGDHRRHLGWDLDLLVLHGTAATALGSVTQDLLSGRAAFLLHHRVPYLTLRGGVGGRLGAARLSGEPANPTTTLGAVAWGPWGGPLLTIGMAAATSRVRLDLSVEAGYVVSPVAARVGGRRAAAIDGTWFGVQLGIGVLLHRQAAP